MNRLLLFAELILDYWGAGGEKKVFPASPPFPSLPPFIYKKKEQEKEKGNRARMCPVPGGRGEGVLFFV